MRYFNTSHVTVYPSLFLLLLSVVTFQYISCYCLSEQNLHRRFRKWNFNTSHVTVYLYSRGKEQSGILISIHLMLLFISQILHNTGCPVKFQYISCYCLSVSDESELSDVSHFNTSHVTVYHCVRRFCKSRKQISIHLMLLFILLDMH